MTVHRERLETLYSVCIIILVPVLLVVNTIFITRLIRNAYNVEIRNRADAINTVIAVNLEQAIAKGDAKAATAQLNAIQAAEQSIKKLFVVQQNGTNQLIIAKSGSAAQALTTSDSIQTKLVYDRKQSVARLVNYSENGNQYQAWNVSTPIMNKDSVVGIVSSTFSTAQSQAVLNSIFIKSFAVLFVSIVVIVLLLIRHFRLVGYIQLLAKQKELNQTMSDFLSVATHELKAPTTIIKGYIANVMDGTFGTISKEINDQLAVALSQVDRMNNLVQDLLNVSRVEQGRIEYKIEPVDSTALLNIIVSNYSPIAAEKGLQLIFERKADLPAVKADAGRVQEVFTNLIDNAIKYTPSGSVTITQELQAKSVVTTIRDTGLGISKENQKRLFQRFYRVRNEGTKDISGTGLGLWIIRQYIIAMGGTISLDSSEGNGTTFTVALPINT